MTPEARLRTEFTEDREFGQGAGTAPARSATSRVEECVNRAVNWLLSVQSPDGYWWGELEADTTLESDYILYLHILGQSQSGKIPKLAKYIRDRQLPDGGWNIFYGGPAELNASVKAYVGLRLAGDSASAPHMESAKRKIHELGGLEATNSYVRFYLAMVGALDWGHVPSIPPELMLLPNWFPLNIWEMSSWTRGIVIPLAIIYAQKPGWKLPEGVTVGELFKLPGTQAEIFSVGQARNFLAEFFPGARPRAEGLRTFAVEAVSRAGAGPRAENGCSTTSNAAKGWERFSRR